MAAAPALAAVAAAAAVAVSVAAAAALQRQQQQQHKHHKHQHKHQRAHTPILQPSPTACLHACPPPTHKGTTSLPHPEAQPTQRPPCQPAHLLPRYGFIIMDGNGSLFGTLSGNTREILHKFQVDLPKKHGRGGQSALRFARLRMEKRHNYVRKASGGGWGHGVFLLLLYATTTPQRLPLASRESEPPPHRTSTQSPTPPPPHTPLPPAGG